MKRNILCIIIAMLSIGMVFSQEETSDITRRGYMTTMAVSPIDDTAGNRLLNNILTYDIDVTDITSPNLLRLFANFSIRRVTFGKRETIYNEKLVTLLQSMYDKVEVLEKTEQYIKELRIIIQDSRNLYIISNAMALYGAIIEKNPPKQREEEAYSPKRLYLLDTLQILVRVSSFNLIDDQVSHLLRITTPTIRKILQEDKKATIDADFQKYLFYMSKYYTSRLSSGEVKKIIIDVIEIEIAEELAFNNR